MPSFHGRFVHLGDVIPIDQMVEKGLEIIRAAVAMARLLRFRRLRHRRDLRPELRVSNARPGAVGYRNRRLLVDVNGNRHAPCL